MVVQQLQDLLAGIYDVPQAQDVAQFLFTDRAALPAAVAAGGTDEQLLVAEQGDTLHLGLFLEVGVLERLAVANPLDELHGGNLADYCTALEGVSHFTYLAWNAAHDRSVTLLELELQAEIDKYVSGLWLLRAQDPNRFPAELYAALFERAHVDATLAGERADMYRQANQYAARFCRHLARTLRSSAPQARSCAVAELRRFYRLTSACKIHHIEHSA